MRNLHTKKYNNKNSLRFAKKITTTKTVTSLQKYYNNKNSEKFAQTNYKSINTEKFAKSYNNKKVKSLQNNHNNKQCKVCKKIITTKTM